MKKYLYIYDDERKIIHTKIISVSALYRERKEAKKVLIYEMNAKDIDNYFKVGKITGKFLTSRLLNRDYTAENERMDNKYKRLTAKIDKQKAIEFQAKLSEWNTTYTEWLNENIDNFLKELEQFE